MASTSTSDQQRSKCCFERWMKTQEQDLLEIVEAQQQQHSPNCNGHRFRQLAEKSIKRFQDYIQERSQLARTDVSGFFAPTWCTSWENSLLWIAGCRPSIFIRLVYALSGMEIESQLQQFLEGTGSGNLGTLSANQLNQISNLQRKIIKEEDRLTGKLASLQEMVADSPFAVFAKKMSRAEDLTDEVDKAVDDNDKSMLEIMEDADQLRLNSLKELLNILRSEQAVDFLACSKKLHLCVHEWGKKRDQRHGRESS